MKSIARELTGAFAVPIVLSVLKEGDSYGYEIVRKVKNMTNKEVKWNEPSIYPVLKKLEKSGLIKSYWVTEKVERPRKYYSILPKGNKQLEQNKHEWIVFNSVLEKLWNNKLIYE